MRCAERRSRSSLDHRGLLAHQRAATAASCRGTRPIRAAVQQRLAACARRPCQLHTVRKRNRVYGEWVGWVGESGRGGRACAPGASPAPWRGQRWPRHQQPSGARPSDSRSSPTCNALGLASYGRSSSASRDWSSSYISLARRCLRCSGVSLLFTRLGSLGGEEKKNSDVEFLSKGKEKE